ncbi:MAG: hypothetical protein ACRDZ1_05160 [Acidimicrobiia bacterium]
MPSQRSAQLAARLRWKPAATTVAALALWSLLVLANRGTTYHFAPLIVAAGGPVAARLDTDVRLPWREVLGLGAASVAAAVLGLSVLWSLGALDGPAVVGGSAPAETSLAIAVGAAAGLVIGRFPGKAQRDAAPSVHDQKS